MYKSAVPDWLDHDTAYVEIDAGELEAELYAEVQVAVEALIAAQAAIAV